MKKSMLVLTPVLALLVGGCTSTPKKKAKSSSVDMTSTISSQVTSNSSGTVTTSSVTSASTDPTTAPTSLTTNVPTTASSFSPTTAPTSLTTNVPTTGSSIAPTSQSTSTTSIPPQPGDIKIEGIFLTDPCIEAKIGKRTGTPLFDIIFADGYGSESVDYTLSWSLEDPTLGEVDQYGRITGIKKGKTRLLCETDVDHRTASTTVYIYESESDFEKSWKRMGSDDVLEAGDQIIIASPNHNKAANTDDTGMKLHSASIILSSDKSEITNVGEAARFVVGTDYKGRDGYNLEVPEREGGKYLACTNEKKISFFDTPKASSNLWEITYDSEQGVWDMRSATTIDGWMMYNVDLDRFAPYENNETEHMVVISLYRLTRTFK